MGADKTNRDPGPLSPICEPGEATIDRRIRPSGFDEFVGQKNTVENIKVFVSAAKSRGESLDHILLCGPPGLGKTTLANIIANELGVSIYVTSGPALEKKGDLAGILTNLKPKDVLFIDEIHRLSMTVEENLYPAMEDFKFDFIIDSGPFARTVNMPLQPFTLIGATTRTGLLGSPLRDRFGFTARLDYYQPSDLFQIVRRSSGILNIAVDEEAAHVIARRSRGTPRICNRLLRRVRDFAEVGGKDRIDLEVAERALSMLEVDIMGLDKMDHRILSCIIGTFNGGPVGLETLAAAIGEEADTISDVYEPYLLQEGLLMRTPRGREATDRAYEHLGRKRSGRGNKRQGSLFDDDGGI